MRLKETYKKNIAPKLKEKLGLDNIHEVPKLTKVVVNVGFGRHAKEKAYMEAVVDSLTRLSGQKPIQTKAKKAISSFKIRQGMVIGACVTLRGERMYDFVEKLVNVTYPRVRDFRGISQSSVDRNGNMTVGFKEHVSFPEIMDDEVDNVFGLEICLATSTNDRDHGLALFKALGFPFKEQDKK